MRFLITVSLLTAAVVLLSKAAKPQRPALAEGLDEDDDYGYDHQDTERQAYEDRSLYAEPSALTIPEKHEGDSDGDNRPEYSSENEPQLTVEALRGETGRD